MNLQEFVKESLVQISTAITEANKEITNLSHDAEEGGLASVGMVNPVNISTATKGEKRKIYARTCQPAEDNSRIVELIDFEVAITVDDSKEKSSGGVLAVAIGALGAQSKEGYYDGSISTIRFKVPMVYPGYNNL